MNMQETIQFIQVSPQEIKDDILNGVNSIIENLKKDFQPKAPSEFLTRNELAKLLKVDLSTVWQWSKKGKLIPYGLGNRVYYKRHEVEQSLIPLNE